MNSPGFHLCAPALSLSAKLYPGKWTPRVQGSPSCALLAKSAAAIYYEGWLQWECEARNNPSNRRFVCTRTRTDSMTEKKVFYDHSYIFERHREDAIIACGMRPRAHTLCLCYGMLRLRINSADSTGSIFRISSTGSTGSIFRISSTAGISSINICGAGKHGSGLCLYINHRYDRPRDHP